MTAKAPQRALPASAPGPDGRLRHPGRLTAVERAGAAEGMSDAGRNAPHGPGIGIPGAKRAFFVISTYSGKDPSRRSR